MKKPLEHSPCPNWAYRCLIQGTHPAHTRDGQVHGVFQTGSFPILTCPSVAFRVLLNLSALFPIHQGRRDSFCSRRRLLFLGACFRLSAFHLKKQKERPKSKVRLLQAFLFPRNAFHVKKSLKIDTFCMSSALFWAFFQAKRVSREKFPGNLPVLLRNVSIFKVFFTWNTFHVKKTLKIDTFRSRTGIFSGNFSRETRFAWKKNPEKSARHAKRVYFQGFLHVKRVSWEKRSLKQAHFASRAFFSFCFCQAKHISRQNIPETRHLWHVEPSFLGFFSGETRFAWKNPWEYACSAAHRVYFQGFFQAKRVSREIFFSGETRFAWKNPRN